MLMWKLYIRSEEDFSYFTLLKPATDTTPATSLFGISCSRQLDANALINKPADVTRSTVQKAVVVIADSPQYFGMLRERLGMVTHAWFAQREFTDVEILRRFQESLADEKSRGTLSEGAVSRDQYLGMSLRELIHEFKWQTLVLLKCCLLQPKMLFFGSRCDRLCMVQFSLISLIPGLIKNLQDCADPELNKYAETLVQPTTLQSSNRSSLLQFMGLPLQLFGKGSIFGPYTPLQQLDLLADVGTKSYIVGSTNSLLLQQKDKYSDIIINLDDNTIGISSPSLRSALTLTAADRRWIDFLTQEINETWDETNPSRPKTMQYAGSEEFIRSQFEAYILGLISSVKYHNFLQVQAGGSKNPLAPSEEDPAVDYGLEWIEAWSKTENYRLWSSKTDPNLFAVSEPKHPSAGGLTIDDVQRRIAEQVKDLHIDEKLAQGREMLGRNLAAGRDKASSMFNKLYSDMEYLRESQRRRAEEAKTASEKTGSPGKPASGDEKAQANYPVDLAKAQQTMQNVGNKAGAYVSSWASWAGEKRKNGNWGWRNSGSAKDTTTPNTPGSPIDKDYQIVNLPSESSTTGKPRPITQESFGESILSNASSSADRPTTASSVDGSRDAPLEGLGITTGHVPSPSPKKKDDGFQTEDLVGATSKAKVEQPVEEAKAEPSVKDVKAEHSVKEAVAATEEAEETFSDALPTQEASDESATVAAKGHEGTA